MFYRKDKGFTLVELIVVITILAILATIGFISFIGYQKSARESTRLSDIKLIEKQLSIYEVRNSTIPLPDNSVTITASGTTIGYQGEVGTGVLVTLKQAGDIKDPLDSGRYSFFVDNTRENYQIMAMMEKEESLRTSFLPQTYAVTDYSERYPRIFGPALGILTDINNTPLEKIAGLTSLDVVNTGTGYTAHYTDTESITGTGVVLHEIIQNSNCKRIKHLTNSQNGVYIINPKGLGEIEVYCEMSMDNGGWVLVARSVLGGSGNFGWNQSAGSVGNDSLPYSLGVAWKNINFNEIAFTGYGEGKEIEYFGMKADISNFDLLGPRETDSFPTASCQVLFYDEDALVIRQYPTYPLSCSPVARMGDTAFTNHYVMNGRDDMSIGLYPNSYLTPAWGGQIREFNVGYGTNPMQGMIFVR